MFTFPQSFSIPKEFVTFTNFENFEFLLNLPTIQDLPISFGHPVCNYPVNKHLKNNNAEVVEIKDPDCFFRKDSDADDDIHYAKIFDLDYERSSSYHNTEDSAFATSPSVEFTLSNYSDLLSPESIPLEFERKLSASIMHREYPQNITTKEQLVATIANDFSVENLSLIRSIEQAFQGSITSSHELVGLSSIEANIVDAILQKKDFNQKNKKQKGKKREEEKQKFFFKGLLKHTETKFLGDEDIENKRSKKKQVKKNSYYEYYWREVAKEHNIDLSNFFHPNKKLASGKTTAQISSVHNPGLKSLNATYIDLILTSDKFKVDTIDYLDNVFMAECQKARVKKIVKLIIKLNGLANNACKKTSNFTVNEQVAAVNSALSNYLIENPKSKLPWTDSELQETRDFAYSVILRQSVKSSKDSLRQC